VGPANENNRPQHGTERRKRAAGLQRESRQELIMSQDHRLQQQRFELKYLIHQELTGPIRDFISSYLDLDDYAGGHPGLSYPVHSLYLDSNDLWTHRAAENGTKNRFKLRLRYYDDDPGKPVFVEVKARVNDCILKQRCGIRRPGLAALLAGHLPEPDQVLAREERHWVALRRFHWLQNQLGARPRLHNAYLREAWVSPDDNSLRVTFDREILAEPFLGREALVRFEQATRLVGQFVVLELKFTTRFPNWLRDMISHFGLMQSSFSKYSHGIEALGEKWFSSSKSGWRWERESRQTPADVETALLGTPVMER
jgi:hypothetical protein